MCNVLRRAPGISGVNSLILIHHVYMDWKGDLCGRPAKDDRQQYLILNLARGKVDGG